MVKFEDGLEDEIEAQAADGAITEEIPTQESQESIEEAVEEMMAASSDDIIAEEVIGDEEAEAAAEASGEAVPFDEEQLLELAKTEGLLDPSLDQEPPADPATPLDMSDSEQANIMASIETILFMSDKPVSLPKLRATINSETPIAAYRVLMAKLRAEFNQEHRGIEIAEVSMGFQLRTKAHMASVLRKMVKTQPLRLSSATMEVLAVTAYKQPVTKDEIDQIRGVDSGYVLRNLMEKRLVRIAGRSDLPGKPMVYGTTHEFLELFNMKDTHALPPLHEVESMVAASEVGFEEKTQAVMQEFGKMVATAGKILFDDSEIDTELEALRAEIASIPTSTNFIDEQKAKEKLDAKLAELATQGLTLDAEGKVVPIGSIPAVAEAPIATTAAIVSDREITIQMSGQPVTTETTAEQVQTAEAAESPESGEHKPSTELEADAAAAQWERHAAMIADAIAQTQVEGETVVVNAEALADAVLETKIEQELASHELDEPELTPET